MPRVIYAPEAEADILAIARRIAEDNLEAAERFIDVIDQEAELLATPAMGRQRGELAPDLRSFPHRHYVIFYRTTLRGVEVVRVLHGSRDIPPLFE